MLPIFIIVVAVVVGIAVRTDSQYSASRSVAFVRTGIIELTLDDTETPEVVETARNPYDAFNGSTEVTAEIMADVAQSREFRRNVGSIGVPNDHTVRVDDDAPILTIDTVGDTPEQALDASFVVIRLLREDLEQRQTAYDIPIDRQMIADDVVVPRTTTEVTTTRDRALIGAIIAGIVLVVLGAVIADAIANRPRRSRSDDDGVAEDAVDPVEDDDDARPDVEDEDADADGTEPDDEDDDDARPDHEDEDGRPDGDESAHTGKK